MYKQSMEYIVWTLSIEQTFFFCVQHTPNGQWPLVTTYSTLVQFIGLKFDFEYVEHKLCVQYAHLAELQWVQTLKDTM